MRNSEVRSKTAGGMGGGMSFPLVNYCSVYLVNTLHHCGPAHLEWHTQLDPCATRRRRTYFITFYNISSSLIPPFFVPIRREKDRHI